MRYGRVQHAHNDDDDDDDNDRLTAYTILLIRHSDRCSCSLSDSVTIFYDFHLELVLIFRYIHLRYMAWNADRTLSLASRPNH